MPNGGPAGDVPPGGAARQAALREALRDAVEATRSQGGAAGTPPRARGQSTGTAWGVVALGAVVLVWIWAARPAWVFGDPPAQPTAATLEARARYAIYIQRVRVEDHLGRVGRLPDDLAALGADPGVPVRLLPQPDGSYDLRAEVAGAPLVFNSRMDADSFLGDALATLRAGR